MNRFPRVMALRLGYDPQQVDDFVRRIERTLGLGSLDGPPVTADEIRNVRFAVTFGGYNETAVDFALDAFIVAIEAKAGRDAQAPARGTADAVPGPAAGAPVRGGGMVVVRAPEGQGSGGPGAGDREVPPPPAAMTPVTGAAASPASATASPASATTSRASATTSRATGSAPEPGVQEPGVQEPGVQEPGAPEPARGEPARPEHAVPSASWLETQAARAERVVFRPGRLGMGYREEEVDAFLDRVVATLRGTAAEPLTAEQVRRATFATVVFRPGYAIREVDDFLAEMASVLERRP